MSEADLDPFQVPDVIDHAPYSPYSTTYLPLITVVSPTIQHLLPFRTTVAHLANSTKERRCARVQETYAHTALEGENNDALAVNEYCTTKRDIIRVHFSPHAYHAGFDIEINLKKFATINSHV